MFFTTSRGVDIHFVETGEGPPVLYLHTGPGVGGDWRGLIAGISGYRHITPDLLGRGRSGWVDGYAMADEAEWAAELIAARGGRAHVVGHSYGGAAAVALAAQASELVASLSLYEPQLIPLLAEGGETAMLAKVRRFYIETLSQIAAGEGRAAWTRFIETFNGPGAWDVLPERVQARILALNPKMPAFTAALTDNRVGRAALGGVTAPTLVLIGERTTMPERRMAELTADMIPGASIAEMSGAGHMGPLTHPGPVAARIAAHMAAHPL